MPEHAGWTKTEPPCASMRTAALKINLRPELDNPRIARAVELAEELSQRGCRPRRPEVVGNRHVRIAGKNRAADRAAGRHQLRPAGDAVELGVVERIEHLQPYL